MNKKFVYDAFISYRHTKLDTAVADKLQRLLERYVPPSSVTGGKPAKKLRIFRDETELPTSSNLSEDIRNALERSRFLIVICSKTTAQSKWCMEEITYFKELHGGKTDKILTLLTDGEPSEVFPPELRTEIRTHINAYGIAYQEMVDIEPLAANVTASSEKESLKKLNREYLRIAAPLYGCGYDMLYNRNQRRFMRRVVVVSAALVLFLAAFTIYSVIMLVQISTQRDELVERNIQIDAQRGELTERNTALLIQESLYLSRESAALLAVDDRIGAINAAIAALPAEDEARPWLPQAEFALSQALYAHHGPGVSIDRRLTHSSIVEEVMFSSDGTRIVSRDRLDNIYIWDSTTGEQIRFFSAQSDLHGGLKGIALSDTNHLFVISGYTFICIDVATGEIVWENDLSDLLAEYNPIETLALIAYMDDAGEEVIESIEAMQEIYESMQERWEVIATAVARMQEIIFGERLALHPGSIVLSGDGSTAALVSLDAVFFADTANGEILSYHRLLDAHFLVEGLTDNGIFSADNRTFLIGTHSPLAILGSSERTPGKLFRICLDTGVADTQEFEPSGVVIGIYADEDIEIIAVSGYGEEGNGALLAFSPESGEVLWEQAIEAGSGWRGNILIYRHNTSVLVVYGSTSIIINGITGEQKTRASLDANFVHGMALSDFPDRLIISLANGVIFLTNIDERHFDPTSVYYRHTWVSDMLIRFRDDLHIACFLMDSTISQQTISSGVRYAIVLQDARNYIVVASYLTDNNYIGVDANGVMLQTSLSADGALLAYAISIQGEISVYVADTGTGEVLYRWEAEQDQSAHITVSRLSFDAYDNIVICTNGWLGIIDWRSGDVLFAFDASDAMGEGWNPLVIPLWESTVAGDYAFFTTRREHFLVNTIRRSYQQMLIDGDMRIRLNNSILSSNGDLTIYSTCIVFGRNKLVLITSESTQPLLIADNFIGRNNMQSSIAWSEDGLLLAAINIRDEAIIYDMQTLERVNIIPLAAPIGISFTPNNQYLMALSASGTLHEYSLADIGRIRQLNVFDSTTAPRANRAGAEMFRFLSLDGRDSITITAGNFANSYIVDLEEFALRTAIPSFGAFNEQRRIFAQYDSRTIRLRHFYTTDELLAMARAVLTNTQE